MSQSIKQILEYVLIDFRNQKKRKKRKRNKIVLIKNPVQRKLATAVKLLDGR